MLRSKDCLFLESTRISETGGVRKKDNLTDEARYTSNKHGLGRGQDISRRGGHIVSK